MKNMRQFILMCTYLAFAVSAAVNAQEVTPVLVEHEIPTSASEPGGIIAGPDGAMWFVETAANKIGRISSEGVITEYDVPTAGAIDTDQGFLAVGPDGALWFNEDLVNKVGRITTTGQFTEYALPPEFAQSINDDLGTIPIRGLVAGPDGGLWVTSPSANAIAKLTTDGKVAAKYTLPTPASVPVGIVVGPDDALWFVEAFATQVGRMTLDGTLSEYALPADSRPLRLTVGPDGAIWFTMFGTNQIGRISMDGKLTLFDAPGMGPVGIAAGADGALWFTGYSSNEIGRMTTDGELSKIQVPTAESVPYHIAAGPDGSLWFTEQQGNKIGQIILPQALTTFTSKVYKLPLTVSFGGDWRVTDDFTDLVTLEIRPKDMCSCLGFNLVTDAQLVDPADEHRVPFPEDFLAWLESNPDFSVGESKQVTVGGITGLQIDATPVWTSTTRKKKPFLYLRSTGWNIVSAPERWRFILLDNVNGERLLILLMSPADVFDTASRQAQSILDSVVFTK